MTRSPQVLVIDDDPSVRHTVRLACEQGGFSVREAGRADAALAHFQEFEPDVVLLDVMLPDGSGFEVCRDLRDAGARMPIIILSGRSEEVDVVVGLELGADDYIVKPFRPRELLARISAQLRTTREQSAPDDLRLRFDDLVIDRAARRVTRGDQPVTLTHTEFELLVLLASQSGKVVSRDKILREVWGYEIRLDTRTIDVHVHNLRRKIEPDPSKPEHIQSVPGVGYRFRTSRRSR